MANLNKTGLAYFWAKIKTWVSGNYVSANVYNAKISALETKLAQLETALNSKQDKIETWGDLKGE